MKDTEYQASIIGNAMLLLLKNASDTFPNDPEEGDWHLTKTNQSLHNFYEGLWHEAKLLEELA